MQERCILGRSWVVVVGVTLALGGVARAADVPPRIQGLFAALGDPNPGVVARALVQLVEADMAEPGVRQRLETFAAGPRMVHLLRAEDRYVRSAAVRTLGALGPAAEVHLPLLAERLDDTEEEVLLKALEALGGMGAVASDQAPRLVDLLRDPRGQVVSTAGKALEAMGAAASTQAPRLVELLREGNLSATASQFVAVDVLGKMGGAANSQLPALANLLRDPNGLTWMFAMKTLGRMGAVASSQVPAITPFLQHPDAHIRAEAAEALGSIGGAAGIQIPGLTVLLRDKDVRVQMAAVGALARMGTVSSAQVDALVAVIQKGDWYGRYRAGDALKEMGPGASLYASAIAGLLQHEEEEVREAAVMALGAMGTVASAQAPQLVVVLRNDPSRKVLAEARRVLGKLGVAASAQLPEIARLLRHKDRMVRLAALDILYQMGSVASAQHVAIAPLLRDSHPRVREGAVSALGAIGAAASEHLPAVNRLLRDKDAKVKQAAAKAVRKMGRAAVVLVPGLVELLQNEDEHVRKEAVDSLLALVAPDFGVVAAALAVAPDRATSERQTLMVLAHAACGGEPGAERLLQWLGRPPEEVPSRLTLDDARETLKAFVEFWPRTEAHPVLRRELARLSAEVTGLVRGRWEDSDRELLELHANNLGTFHSIHAETVRTVIVSIERWRTLKTFGWSWAAHAGFWFLLLFFYPRSPQVQAFFFWNPWVRRITGLGYVSLLLTWVPFLRRRLLSPFGKLLLAEAQLKRFSATTYFEGAEVFLPASGRREPLLRVLPCLRGQVVLEGASGLGKSMFLKYLLAHSRRQAVFLPAERCRGGVLEAIQVKLEGHAKDATFLRSLIYSGALDIYIDGLNEVTADTRARIVQFVESNFHGNILLTTQPIEWTAPATASRYVLQPLSDEQLVRFLESREPVLAEKAPVRGQAYLLACQRFVAEVLSPEQPVELRQAHSEVLSNPMDLTVVAQMLSEERQPDLFHLRQQQYELMARDYREVHLDGFPLKAFSEEAYEMRCEDRGVIPEEKFGRELLRMEAAKMVLRQQWRSPDGKEQREWRFRHDKIQEFFIAQTFLGKDNRRVSKHLKDSRFRGVYLLLALLLEPEQAQALRDMLVEHAAETRDHSVSDDFVTLLKKRQGAEKARGNRSRGVV
ncbi:HEAT repeat domain-containing protein [Archangium lansingense]|uniref:HEAT repeat domain-containing protein n=1 Tax=Archangium lansingense TaxID=2995310 RepID=UPI003B76C8D5